MDLDKILGPILIISVIKKRRMGWAGHIARLGGMRSGRSILVGKPERERTSVSPRRRWEDNIRMDLKKIWWDGVDWISLCQDRDQWRALVNINEP
jgi:hypothetical protein